VPVPIVDPESGSSRHTTSSETVWELISSPASTASSRSAIGSIDDRGTERRRFDVMGRTLEGRTVGVVAVGPANGQCGIGDQNDQRTPLRDSCGPEFENRVGADEHKPDFVKHQRGYAPHQHLTCDRVLFDEHALLVGQNREYQVERINEPDSGNQANNPVRSRRRQPREAVMPPMVGGPAGQCRERNGRWRVAGHTTAIGFVIRRHGRSRRPISLAVQ